MTMMISGERERQNVMHETAPMKSACRMRRMRARRF